MAAPSFWNFAQKALREKMVVTLGQYGLPHHDAEAWAALTFAQYDSFQNLTNDGLSNRSYEILRGIEVGNVELKHLPLLMQGDDTRARTEIWNDFIRIQTGRALMAHCAKVRGLKYDQLSEIQRERFLQGGISAAKWDAIRSISPVIIDGVECLSPKNVPAKEPSETYGLLIFLAAEDVFGGLMGNAGHNF